MEKTSSRKIQMLVALSLDSRPSPGWVQLPYDEYFIDYPSFKDCSGNGRFLEAFSIALNQACGDGKKRLVRVNRGSALGFAGLL